MKFWLEEIASCPNHQLVALTATKDVQDAVLQDSLYNKMVDIIDIRQWHYRNDGSLYEPQGGCSLAPRQWARLIDPVQRLVKAFIGLYTNIIPVIRKKR